MAMVEQLEKSNTNGNAFTASASGNASLANGKMTKWIVDSGSSQHITGDGGLVHDPKPHKAKLELQGSLQYAVVTKPDILAPLKLVSKSKACEQNVQALKRIVRYLRCSKRGLLFNPLPNVHELGPGMQIVLAAWSDADWAGMRNPLSATGNIVNLNGNPIMMRSLTQRSIASSVSESEIYGMSEAAKSGLRFRHLLEELIPALFGQVIPKPRLIQPIPMFADNQGSIKFTTSTNSINRLKHIGIRDALIRQLVERGDYTIIWMESKKNKANGLTKILTRADLIEF